MNREPTNLQIIQTVQGLAKNVHSFNHKFDKLNEKVDGLADNVQGLNTRVDGLADNVQDTMEAVHSLATNIDERFEQVDRRFEQVDKRLVRIESSMVTKDYLDKKLGDLKGDLISLVKKEDNKVNAFIDSAVSNRAIKKQDAKRLLAMDPFARN